MAINKSYGCLRSCPVHSWYTSSSSIKSGEMYWVGTQHNKSFTYELNFWERGKKQQKTKLLALPASRGSKKLPCRPQGKQRSRDAKRTNGLNVKLPLRSPLYPLQKLITTNSCSFRHLKEYGMSARASYSFWFYGMSEWALK